MELHLWFCYNILRYLMDKKKSIYKIGIVIEFKKIDDFLKTTIEEGTIAALKQIEDMKYSQELIDRGIKNIIKLAIVFKGKEIKITEGN